MDQHLYQRLKTLEQSQISKMDEVKIEGHSDLRKNLVTGAVINNDKIAYERYLNSKKEFTKMNSSMDDINSLKEEISEIKSLLKELLKKNV